MTRKIISPLKISLRKNEIYKRRIDRETFSSLEEAHRIIEDAKERQKLKAKMQSLKKELEKS